MFVSLPDIPDYIFSSLNKGADNREHPLHLLTLATVGADGRPSARLMINRGVDRAKARLWFHTDLRSPKVADLRSRPEACIIAWDPRTCVEIRLSGRCTIHSSDPLAQSHWDHFSRTAMWLYEHPQVPQQDPGDGPVDLRLPNDQAALSHALTARARAQFAVLQVQIDSIDWLQATDRTQVRAALRADEDWLPRSVS